MYALACFLALVLGSAAIHKLVARTRLTRATGRLLGLNDALAAPAMYAAAAIEAVAALALLIPATQAIGATIAFVLWLGYGAALHFAHRRGDDAFDCGCSFGKNSNGIDLYTRLRPLVLALVALGVAAMPGAVELAAPFAGLAFFAMYLAAGELAALPSRQRSIAR